MKLILTDDDGVVLESWYLAPEETATKAVAEVIEHTLEVYADRGEYEAILSDINA